MRNAVIHVVYIVAAFCLDQARLLVTGSSQVLQDNQDVAGIELPGSTDQKGNRPVAGT